jgi:hypothetical protein
MTRVLQAFQKAFTPTGTPTFKARPIELFNLKVDVQEYPDELVQSWLGFLSDNNTDRKTWPFVKWWITTTVEQSKEDYELYEVFAGEYAAPTGGTAAAAGTGMNGIRYIVNAGIDDSTITPILTGALETDAEAFVEQIEAFADGIDYRYRRTPMTIAMSLDNETLYKRGMRAKYNVNYNQAENLASVMDLPNLTVKGYASWGSSDKIVCSPKANSLRPVKGMGVPLIQSDMRLVKAAWNDWKGVGYLHHELVFTNDQDLNE